MSTSLEEALNVLIVDDDEVDRMALSRALRAASLNVVIAEATDADAALALVADVEPDCIFLDYHLPGRNGLSLVRRMRRMGIQVPLIVLTGQGNEQTAVELMKAGASDYLPKSKLSAETIARLVRSAMRVYRAERTIEDTNRRLREKNQLLEQKNYELERQRRQIYKQNLQLQEVSRLKSEFLATMSHELRTPLNAIIGFSQILINKTKGPLTDYQQDMLSRVLSNGKNLLELINDILAFSRIEAGRLELEPVAFNLANLVRATVEDLRSLAAQKSISLELEVMLDDPIIINDIARVRQIVVNLLSNAIKFTSQGSVCVVIAAGCAGGSENSLENGLENNLESGPENSSEDTSENRTARSPHFERAHPSSQDVAISVLDTGCGISALDQVYIFDAFHQSDQKVTRRHAGTGLGLAITHSLVKMMKGEITVESEVGEGSLFLVILPREVKIDKKQAPKNTAQQANSSSISRASSTTRQPSP